MLNKIINTVYSFGAAIVIFGAWAKIEYKPFAGDALTVGLMVEVSIFCLYGLLEWRKADERPQTPTKEKDPDLHELTTSVRQTNKLLNKVFRAD
jgi:hypothetical protein